MPSKSQHRKRKYSNLSKVQRQRLHSLSAIGPKLVATLSSTSVTHNTMVNYKASVPVTLTYADTEENHYIKAELLKVDILTGIIFFIMIVLGLFLH